MKQIDQERLAADLAASGIYLNREALDRLWHFHCILRDRNRKLNLTRLYRYETMVRKHYVDCLLVPVMLAKNNLALEGPVMDLGSGGGFPGMPLAIALPEISWYLVEGRENRCAYLKETAIALGLTNVTVYWRKLQPDDTLPVRTVITRAVEAMKETAQRLRASLEKNGLLVFMKGPHCDDEIRSMQSEPYELVLDQHYMLPGSESDRRRLVVFRRASEMERGRRIYPYGKFSEHWKQALHITSSENPRYKLLKKIAHGKARAIHKEGRTIVFGRRIVEEVLQQSPHNIEAVLFDERSVKKVDDLIARLASEEARNRIVLSSSLIDGLGLKGFEPPYLLYRVSPIPRWDGSLLTRPTLFLPLGDPENLGQALRSALAFGFKNIVLLEEAASPYLPAVIRASSGASLRLNYTEGPSILNLAGMLEKLSDHGLETPEASFFYLDRAGQPLSAQTRPPNAFGLIVGEEGRGIPDGLRDLARKGVVRALSIPISTEIDSLNAAVSLSIAMYQLSRS
jgi:16S rRNA (guanine527-N7)-methyltransferase